MVHTSDQRKRQLTLGIGYPTNKWFITRRSADMDGNGQPEID